MISEDKVAEIRERASIVEIIGEYVNLKRSGANFQGLCPFHGEKTPSFNVNPAREIFHCFGCGVGGNVFSFIMKIEGLTFPEAARFLAKKTGVTIDERPLSEIEKRRKDERDLLYRVNETAAEFYRHTLLHDRGGEPGRRYLEKRGVQPSTAESYRLGFAPDRWDGLVRHLEQKRISLDVAENLGLIRRKTSGKGFVDLFRNRLVFPIADPQGRVIAFGARVLDDSLPKYINSPESPIYRKSDVLFGVNLARQAMREQDAAIIVEGYFDHLALFQAGVRNVCASCGTALTPGHLKLLQRYAGRVYTLFDSDSAGVKATLRSMELFLDENMPAFVIELPAGEDPDSFVTMHGTEAFAAKQVAARPLFQFFLRMLLQTNDTTTVSGKVKVVEELTPRILKIANPVERELEIREVARLLGINERTLQRKIGRQPVTAADIAKPQPRDDRRGRPEEMLLLLMSRFPSVCRMTSQSGLENLFHDDLRPVAEHVQRQMLERGSVDLAMILEQVASTEERSRLAALFVADEHLEEIDAEKAFEECCRTLQRQHLKNVDMKELRRELTRLDSDSERYWEILRILDGERTRKSQLH